MITKIKSLLASPSFEDEDSAYMARVINFILLALITTVTAILIVIVANGNSTGPDTVGLGILDVALLALLAGSRRGHLKVAQVLIPTAVMFLLAALAATAQISSIFLIAVLALPLVLILAALLLGRWGAWVFAALNTLIIVGLAYLDLNGRLPFDSPLFTGMDDAIIISTLNWAMAAFLYLLMGNLANSLSRARKNETLLAQSNQELTQLSQELETRVENRTADLALAAEIGRSLSQVQSLDELLPGAAALIQERFGLYHTQIYLNQEGTLVLRAATGDAGREMLAKAHHLPIGQGSINGMAAAKREAVIVANTAVDPLFRPNPLLPDTCSEMAVPLLAAGQVVGVLDLQNNQPGVFSEETLPAFEALAGQLAIAIQNADLFTVREQAEEALRESQKKYIDLVEGLPLGIYRNTPGVQGKMLEANAAMVDIFEADSKEEFLAASVAESYQNPEQRQEFSRRLLEHGIAEDVELELITQKGRRFWGAVTAVRKENAAGEIYYDGFIQDVTARKQAEILLNKRARELALLNEIGRMAEEGPQIPDYLTAVATQIPPVMDYPDCCLAAIVYQDKVYGQAAALNTPRQIVEGLRIGGVLVGQIFIAYTKDFPFEDSDSALIGGMGRRISTYLENRQLFSQAQSHLDKLQIVSDVSTAASTTLDTQLLLQNVSDRTKAGFNLYHAHIYLLNDQRGELDLAAGAGEVGRQMVAEGLRIPMSKRQSLVVRAAKTRRGVVVNDVQADPGFLPNPLLPETHAEVAVPMIAGEIVLGVLDVQAAEINAFSDVDVHVFTTLAAQVAAALQNASQYEQTQSALDELSAMQRAMTREGWQAFMMSRERQIYGFVADQKDLWPITSNGEQETVDVVSGLEALTQSETAVVTPLQLYGEKIGGLGVRVSPDKPLDEDQQAILKAISDQVVEALERARLTEQTEMALAETEEQARRRARLNQLSEDLTRTQDLETIYDIVTGAALEMVGGDRTTLMLLSDDQKTVTVLVAHGDVAQVPLNTPLPADAIVRGVIKSRTATLLNDPPGKGGPGGVVSSIVAPLLVSGRVIGTLNLSSKQFNHFDEGDRDLILQVANILSSVVENRQLFTQMQERAEELAIINQVAETVSQHIEPDQLLKAVYDQIQRIMPIDAYHVGLLDAENKQLDYPVMFEDGEWLDSPPVPLNPNSNSYKAIQTAKPVILNLTDEDKETLTQTGSAIGDTSKPMTSSSVFLPLFLGTKVAGVLAVHSYLRNAYDKADVDLLTGIANHVAVALENARLFAESQEHAEELAVLNEMGRTLTTKLDLNSILMDTHRYVTQLLDAKDMYVALYDEETEEVDIKIFGEGEDVVKSALRRRAGNGITEVVLRSRQPLLIKENIEEAAEKYGFDLIGRSSASWLGVPMTVGEKVIGVVAVQDFDRNFAFNEHQQDLLLALSSQVAIAIENVRLFDQEQARAQRERLLREVTEQIRRSSDVDTIMRTAVQEVGRALGRRTYVYLGDKETPAA